MRKAIPLFKKLSATIDIEKQLNKSMEELYFLIEPYFDFSDFKEREYSVKEYLRELSITQQTDCFCFVDREARNIPVFHVLSAIDRNPNHTISYSDFIDLSI